MKFINTIVLAIALGAAGVSGQASFGDCDDYGITNKVSLLLASFALCFPWQSLICIIYTLSEEGVWSGVQEPWAF